MGKKSRKGQTTRTPKHQKAGQGAPKRSRTRKPSEVSTTMTVITTSIDHPLTPKDRDDMLPTEDEEVGGAQAVVGSSTAGNEGPETEDDKPNNNEETLERSSTVATVSPDVSPLSPSSATESAQTKDSTTTNAADSSTDCVEQPLSQTRHEEEEGIAVHTTSSDNGANEQLEQRNDEEMAAVNSEDGRVEEVDSESKYAPEAEGSVGNSKNSNAIEKESGSYEHVVVDGNFDTVESPSNGTRSQEPSQEVFPDTETLEQEKTTAPLDADPTGEDTEQKEENNISSNQSLGYSTEEASVDDDISAIEVSESPIILSEPTAEHPPPNLVDVIGRGSAEEELIFTTDCSKSSSRVQTNEPAAEHVPHVDKSGQSAEPPLRGKAVGLNTNDTTINDTCESLQVTEPTPNFGESENDAAMKELDILLQDSSGNNDLVTNAEMAENAAGLLPEEEPVSNHFWVEPSLILPEDLEKIDRPKDSPPSKADDSQCTRPFQEKLHTTTECDETVQQIAEDRVVEVATLPRESEDKEQTSNSKRQASSNPPDPTPKREPSSGFMPENTEEESLGELGPAESSTPKMDDDSLGGSSGNLSELDRLLEEAEVKRAAEAFGHVSISDESDEAELNTDDEFETETEDEIEARRLAANRPRLSRNKNDMTFSQEIRNETITALNFEEKKQKFSSSKEVELRVREQLEQELGPWKDSPKKTYASDKTLEMKQRMHDIQQKKKQIEDMKSKRDAKQKPDAAASNHASSGLSESEEDQVGKEMVRRGLLELEQMEDSAQDDPVAASSPLESPSQGGPDPQSPKRNSSSRLNELREKVRAKENSVKTLVRRNSARNLNRQRENEGKRNVDESEDSDEATQAPRKRTLSNGSRSSRRMGLQRQPSVKGMRRQRSQRSLRLSRKGSSRNLQNKPHRNSKSPGPSADQHRVHLPTSMRQAVVESWKAVEGKLDKLGMDFFLSLFEQHPQMKDLFRFGGVPTEELHKSKMLQAHANGVMKTIGIALAGLSDMESLIPVLRNLGRIHTMVGVQPHMYDTIYSVLIDTISRFVGPEKWTSEAQEAWELCYTAITAVMKDPSRHLDVEPAEGWGMWLAGTCSYLALVTPLQLAGFGRAWYMQVIFSLLNTVAFTTCLMDLGSDFLQSAIQLKTRSAYRNVDQKWFFLKFKITRIIRRLGLSRWASWPILDSAVIGSFALQSILSWLPVVPMSLFYIVGLIRVLAVLRTIHFFRCLELVSLKSAEITMERFHYGQLGQLFLVLMYMIHLFGCLHCMVSKLSDHTETSTFSPALFKILKSGNMVNAYLHTTYWAFVNVAGIGTYDSVPESSLEILFSMLVHLVGAIIYTSAASYIFAILESRAKAFSAVREGVASLKDFMADCNIPPTSQEAFVSGYLMRNYISRRNKKQRNRENQTTRPLLPEAAEALPSHLTSELTVFSRAKAIRNRGIKAASVEFSFVLAESLNEKITLLSGDYLFQEGDEVSRHVWMVDKGKLEIFVDGVSKRCLYPGDIVGIGWLATDSADPRENARHKAYLDWVSLGGMAIADIRAMDACQLVMGLEHSSQIAELRRLYPSDMERIRDQCEKDEPKAEDL